MSKMDIKEYYSNHMEEKLSKLNTLVGKQVKIEYALQAITCSGFANEYNTVSKDQISNHDGLATVGDTVLKMCLALKLFTENSAVTKGDLTETKKKWEKNANLEMIGKRLSIKEILFHTNTDLSGKKKLATSIEAILGAIYITHGTESTMDFIKKYIL
jgi:dsRNA-specific ribonuclease